MSDTLSTVLLALSPALVLSAVLALRNRRAIRRMQANLKDGQQ